MKKLFVILFCLSIVLTPEILDAQKTSISLGGEVAFPGSNSGLSVNAGTGYGGSLRIETIFGDHVSGLATIGYLTFGQKELSFSGSPLTSAKVEAIPIQIGLKFYPGKKKEPTKRFFFTTEVGFMPTTTHFEYATNPDYDFKESGLSVAPGTGYQLGKIETSFRLQYNLTASGSNIYYTNFRLAYTFQKKKIKND